MECGSTLRLQHSTTKKFLHSHLFSSPLSGSQEVSAFGDNGIIFSQCPIYFKIHYGELLGVGDSGDHWRVVCDGDFWERDDSVTFKHLDTNTYLASSGSFVDYVEFVTSLKFFSVVGHAYGRPINGQLEIVGVTKLDSACKWQAAEGLFVHQSSFAPKLSHSKVEHNEL